MRKTTTALIATATAITGAIAGSAITATLTADSPAKSVHTVTAHKPTVCDTLTDNILNAADILLTAWEANTEYRPAFRTDNIDAYRDIAAQCGK